MHTIITENYFIRRILIVIFRRKNYNFRIGDGCLNCGWGTNERQSFINENHKLAENQLVITAKTEGDKYTSTRFTTKGKREFNRDSLRQEQNYLLGREFSLLSGY
jgi:predicted  nucleic acid-binding Zn-ribbon protein